ncbi:MAG: TetR/AcrR family transcriptional regulator [Bacillota bacterium]
MAQRTDMDKKILKTSLHAFAANGYDGTSMRDIASSVGIQQSSIYNHFKNKEDILLKLFKKYGPVTIATRLRQEKLIRDMKNGRDFLENVINEYYRLSLDKDERDFFRILIREHTREPVRSILRRRFLKDLRHFFNRAFDKMKDFGEIKDIETEILTEEFLGYLIFNEFEHILRNYSLKESEKLKNKTKNHLNFFWNAIKKSGV